MSCSTVRSSSTPSRNDAGSFGEQCADLQRRIEQREKQVVLGKSTKEYFLCEILKKFPSSRRGRAFPKVPIISKEEPKRQFHAKLSFWRRSLHNWENERLTEDQINSPEFSQVISRIQNEVIAVLQKISINEEDRDAIFTKVSEMKIEIERSSTRTCYKINIENAIEEGVKRLSSEGSLNTLLGDSPSSMGKATSSFWE